MQLVTCEMSEGWSTLVTTERLLPNVYKLYAAWDLSNEWIIGYIYYISNIIGLMSEGVGLTAEVMCLTAVKADASN